MNYLLISDVLWYSGHILTGSSILLTHKYFNLAVLFVFLGQFITIISRPIGRLQPNFDNTLSGNKSGHQIIQNNYVI
jgi:hypothetical protein